MGECSTNSVYSMNEGQAEGTSALAAELVSLKVDLIIAAGSP